MLAKIFADGTGQHRSQVLNPVMYCDHTICHREHHDTQRFAGKICLVERIQSKEAAELPL
jgi:hypothetical protein